MTEDSRTLWVGNLDEKVTEELIYELFLQTGPIERLIYPTEGEGENKKPKGHAYVVFDHAESVQYATQVLDGSSFFSQALSMKARGLPITYKKEMTGNTVPTLMSNNRMNRYDNNSLRGGFNRGFSNDFSPRGRGSFRGRGNFNQNQGNFSNFNSYNNQTDQSGWLNQQGSSSGATTTSSTSSDMQDKRQRILNQQNITLNTHQQMQQQNMMSQQQQMNGQWNQQQWNQQQQWMNQGQWNNWNMGYQQQGYYDQSQQYYQQQ